MSRQKPVNPRKLAIADRLANRVEEQRRVERERERLLRGEVHRGDGKGDRRGKEGEIERRGSSASAESFASWIHLAFKPNSH